MMHSVDNLNIGGNKQWFVRMESQASSLSVELYLSLADAQARTNMVSSGGTSGFGTTLPVTLSGVESHNPKVGWQVQVSGWSGDGVSVFRTWPFADHDDITHPIYKNEAIIPYRSAAVIDASTHLDTQHTISTPRVDPLIQVNQGLYLSSAQLGKAYYLTIRSITMELSRSSMTTTIGASKYAKISR